MGGHPLGLVPNLVFETGRRGAPQHGDKPMTPTTAAAPGIVRAGSLRDSIRVEPLTNAIGAELSNVDLGAASREPDRGRRARRSATSRAAARRSRP